MHQRSLVRLVLFACLALVPAGFAAAGPDDEPPDGQPRAVLHQPATVGDTASSLTVWGHVVKVTGYSYGLAVELDGSPVYPSITDTVTHPDPEVDDIAFDVDVSSLGLEEDQVLTFTFTATASTTYSDWGDTAVVAE